MKTGFLLIGKVAKPHGLRGQMKVHSYAASWETFFPGRKVLLGGGEELEEWVISEAKVQARSLILKLVGLEDRQQAERLVGFSVYIEEKDLEALPEGEYYWYQLIGSRVYNDRDQFLGIMEGIFGTPAHDIWVIRDREKEILFPAVEDVILSVNKIQREIHVRDLYDLAEGDDC
jgi:16S rRNA processing protein RimM